MELCTYKTGLTVLFVYIMLTICTLTRILAEWCNQIKHHLYFTFASCFRSTLTLRDSGGEKFYSKFLLILQKGSPYLADANYLLQLSLEMGLKFTDYGRNIGHYIPNATKCDTWNDVEISHRTKSPLVVLNYDDIYGLLIIFGAGIIGSFATLGVEVLVHNIRG